ncbi:MAG: hypothetical protein L6R37_001158 [Teloschistes peruensis]|nr:MAG: hypothetical protein L6R37_001158 [Teloschistes peruensis]
MADRFPSLEEFGDTQTAPKSNGATNGEIDGDDDFLARERALLGDDANQFASSNDHKVSAADDEFDLLGGDSAPAGGQQASDSIGQFESSFPAVDTQNNQMGPGGTITGSNLPYRPTQQSSYSGYQEPEEEPEPIRLWREKRDADIARRESLAATRKAERIEKAQRDIDAFYETYNGKKDKSIARTRKEAEEFLANRQDTSAGGTSWERVAKLVDLSGKGAKGGEKGGGKEKFREMLLELKKDGNAPGAKGY